MSSAHLRVFGVIQRIKIDGLEVESSAVKDHHVASMVKMANYAWMKANLNEYAAGRSETFDVFIHISVKTVAHV